MFLIEMYLVQVLIAVSLVQVLIAVRAMNARFVLNFQGTFRGHGSESDF